MRVSIITATLNNLDTIEECLKSVFLQSHNNIEHIIVDGGSTDGTLEISRKYQDKISKWISEPDHGVYYALNKGLDLTSGDIIGFLHADDFYADEKVVENVVFQITKNNVDSCYGDLLYIDKVDTEKIIRYWKSCPYKEGLFRKGWMPPHPTFFVRKEIYDEYGDFNTDFKISADYELMFRFLGKNKISTYYIPEVFVKMRTGGISNRNIKNMISKSYEDYKICKMNNLQHSIYTVLLKNLSKASQFFKCICL